MKINNPVAQVSAQEEAVRPAPAPIPPKAATAIIVAHGMGQQIPYETIDQVTEGLQNEDARVRGTTRDKLPDPDVRIIRIGEQYLRRAELRLSSAGGERAVHIYEAYWAPKPHGNVTLRDVIGFLLRAGLNGLTNIRKQVHRMLFGEFRKVPARFGDFIALTITLLFVLALVVLDAIVLAAGTAQIGTPPEWLGATLFTDLSFVAMLFNAVAITTGIALSVALLRRNLAGRLPVPYAFVLDLLLINAVLFTIAAALRAALLVAVHRTIARAVYLPDLVTNARAFSTLLVLVTLLLGGIAWAARSIRLGAISRIVLEIAFFLIVILGFWAAGMGWLVLAGTSGLVASIGTAPGWIASAVWVWPFLILVSLIVRKFLVEFLGDVAVYVSSHTLDRFEELRNTIRNCVQGVVSSVYQIRENDADAYDRVIVVGHSLGSVIVYDALNRAILEDQLAANSARVAARTAAIVTFGSPLDKIAYLFAVQSGKTSKTREALVAAGLPLIQDYKFRPPRWINIHAAHDIISGKLDLYDDRVNASPSQRIENLPDPDATIPLIAHTEYWRNELLFKSIHKVI